MRNFYATDNKYLFNANKYLEEWEKSVCADSKNILQSIASHVKNLWQNFNEERKDLDKYYMDSALGQKAYLAGFLLPNIERVFSLLTQNENVSVLESILAEEREELVIADFGAGPLSGSVGILAVIEFILAHRPHINVPKKICIYAIDRSEKIVNAGIPLLKSAIIEKEKVEIHWITSPEKMQKTAHIILCVNILNEIPEKHRLKTLQLLYSKLENNGALLILEPGQQEHAKNLGALRDDFINIATECEIISPCAHKKSCPLSARVIRKDWCWFKHAWNPPRFLVMIDKHSKIDHHELNYSFLFLQKKPTVLPQTFYARCVSDDLHLNKKDVSTAETIPDRKFLLCTGTGALEPIYLNPHDDVEGNDYYRGKRVVASQ